MDAKLKLKLVRVVAILAVAMGAGQLMQSMSHTSGPQKVAHSETAQKAKNIETVAAGAAAAPASAQPQLPALTAPRLPDSKVATASPEAPAPTLPAAPVLADAAKPVEPATPAAPAAVAAADPCAITLDLTDGANAMIGLTLLAGCHPDERVVVKHAGLVFTGKTTATGALFVDLPALQADATVEVQFKDGAKTAKTIAMPDVIDLRRFAVQWQADDAFQIHAFEDDLGYGGPGDVWAEAPHLPAAGLPAKGGFLTVLGDPGTDLPLFAQIYTYPADPKAKAEVVVEAPVTAKACEREILAETLFTTSGKTAKSDLTAAMPGCDAVGDYLVLKNLVPSLNIAAN